MRAACNEHATLTNPGTYLVHGCHAMREAIGWCSRPFLLTQSPRPDVGLVLDEGTELAEGLPQLLGRQRLVQVACMTDEAGGLGGVADRQVGNCR